MNRYSYSGSLNIAVSRCLKTTFMVHPPPYVLLNYLINKWETTGTVRMTRGEPERLTTDCQISGQMDSLRGLSTIRQTHRHSGIHSPVIQECQRYHQKFRTHLKHTNAIYIYEGLHENTHTTDMDFTVKM